MKVNYKLLMDEEIKNIKKMGIKPKLLLHACCAPCSTAVLESLNEIFNISLFFYNPNISPESEFIFRLDELKRLTGEMNISSANVIAPEYDNLEFERVVKGMENLLEGGARCEKCYRMRLEKSVIFAKENEFDYVTTTLSISPYKNAEWLNKIGGELGEKYGVKYLFSDFKKGDGYKRSIELSKKYDLYRQNYCGCIYSKKQAEKERAEKMKIKIYDSLPESAKEIREEVFVKEQGFSDEYDEIDNIATHIVLFDGGEPVATLRLYEKDEKGVYMFGRIAVVKRLRKGGLGREIVAAAEEYVKSKGGNKIVLHAQLQAKGFYEKIGYKVFGEIEYEQDCPHVWVKKIISD